MRSLSTVSSLIGGGGASGLASGLTGSGFTSGFGGVGSGLGGSGCGATGGTTSGLGGSGLGGSGFFGSWAAGFGGVLPRLPALGAAVGPTRDASMIGPGITTGLRHSRCPHSGMPIAVSALLKRSQLSMARNRNATMPTWIAPDAITAPCHFLSCTTRDFAMAISACPSARAGSSSRPWAHRPVAATPSRRRCGRSWLAGHRRRARQHPDSGARTRRPLP